MARVDSSRTVARDLARLRVLVGLVLCIVPRSVLRLQTEDEPSGSFVLMTRTVGIRDFVVGVGSASAARSNNGDDTKRWVTVGLVSDVLDIAAAAVSIRSIGRRAAFATALVPVPVVSQTSGRFASSTNAGARPGVQPTVELAQSKVTTDRAAVPVRRVS